VSKLVRAGNRILEKPAIAACRRMSAEQSDFSARTQLSLLTELARALGVTLDDTTTPALARYVELVVSWNKKLDLTAAKGARAQLEVLLADSLVLASRELIPQASHLVDVGSGAGAPALGLLLVRSDLRGTLVEPLRKRVAFLRTAIGTLTLVERARVLEAKLDPDAPALPAALPSTASFDLALSRATFAPEVWVRVAMQLAPLGIVMLASQPTPPAPDGCKLVREHEYALPWSAAPRRLALYAREGSWT
jgi:16S rRNA (guanine527-N7)-methyltransferase